MTAASDAALVIQLASLTEDRTPAEQRALERLAERTDKIINHQAGPNPHMPRNVGLGSLQAPPCTYSEDHTKECICRGDRVAVEPIKGWSRLLELVTS